MNIQSIKDIDTDNMYDVLLNFHKQIKDAVEIAEKTDVSDFIMDNITNVVINGLGGSAIGGDLVRSYISDEVKTPIFINRNYFLPAFVDSNTLIVISSYSGNTEETVTAYNEAIKKDCKVVCISSGGIVGKMALENGHLLIKIPGGLQPRCALGYSFFTLLILMSKLGLIKDKTDDVNNVVSMIENKSNVFSKLESTSNLALKTAESLYGKLPIIYSSVDILDVVNLRWRGQMSENAKVLAYGNLYPEMNHNELVGWRLNKDILKKTVVVFLKDEDDYERIKFRMDITTEIYSKYTGKIFNFRGEGSSKLTRIFDLIYLGDWVSFYLAILNEINPTPVEAINYLKNELAKK